MKRFLSILLFFAIAQMCAGQEPPWTLSACVRYAREHNLSVKQSVLQQQQRAIELNTARNRVWPTLQANASQSFSFGRGLTEDNTYVQNNTANTSFGLGGSMNLFSGLQTSRNISMGKLNVAAATADLQKAKDDLEVAVISAYAQILYDIEICRVAAAQIVIDSQQVTRINELVRAGKVGACELSSHQSTLAQSRLAHTQASNNLRMATLTLTQLLELPSPDGFTVQTPDLAGFTEQCIAPPEQIYQEALNHTASIQAENIRLDYAKLNVSIVKSAYSPSLSMSGGIVTDYYAIMGCSSKGFAEQLRNNFSPYLGFTLNVPIFNQMATRNSVRTAQLQLNEQQIALDKVRQELFKEIQQAYYATIAAQDKYRSSQTALNSAEETFRLTQAKYEEGKATLTEFNEAKNLYLQASCNLAQAQYEYLFQIWLLDFYQGKRH